MNVLLFFGLLALVVLVEIALFQPTALARPDWYVAIVLALVVTICSAVAEYYPASRLAAGARAVLFIVGLGLVARLAWALFSGPALAAVLVGEAALLLVAAIPPARRATLDAAEWLIDATRPVVAAWQVATCVVSLVAALVGWFTSDRRSWVVFLAAAIVVWMAVIALPLMRRRGRNRADE